MAVARTFIQAPPEQIFDVLSDPRTYERDRECLRRLRRLAEAR